MFFLALIVLVFGQAQAAQWTQGSSRTGVEAVLIPANDVPPDWQEIVGVYATMHYDPSDRAIALHLARHAATAVPELARVLGLPAGRTIHIYLTPTTHLFAELQPRPPPRWADGTAWPHRGWVFLRSPDIRAGTATDLTQVLDHEIVHVLMGRAFGDTPVPRWLLEGCAKLMAREYTPQMTRALSTGLLGKRMLTLDDLETGFPSDPVRAQLAYAQSADLVAYIRNTYGEESLRTLVYQLASGASFPVAIRTSTGKTVDELDTEWRSRLETSLLWVEPLTTDTIWFGLGGLILVVGAFAARRRKRKILQAWSKREAAEDAQRALLDPDTPPYWMKGPLH